MSEPLASLAKKIDQNVNAASPKYPQKLGTFVIMGDAPGRVDELRGLAECEGLSRVTLCVGNAPQRYEINPNADVTVVIYTPGRPRDNQVVANFALRRGELTDARQNDIRTALAKVLPKYPARASPGPDRESLTAHAEVDSRFFSSRAVCALCDRSDPQPNNNATAQMAAPMPHVVPHGG